MNARYDFTRSEQGMVVEHAEGVVLSDWLNWPVKTTYTIVNGKCTCLGFEKVGHCKHCNMFRGTFRGVECKKWFVDSVLESLGLKKEKESDTSDKTASIAQVLLERDIFPFLLRMLVIDTYRGDLVIEIRNVTEVSSGF